MSEDKIINEQELENVSGGGVGLDVLFVKANCAGCANDKDGKCPHKAAMAAQALKQGNVTMCTFRS